MTTKREKIELIKKEVKTHLDSVLSQSGLRARLDAALKELSSVKDSLDDDATIRRFVLCISALVHYALHGGMHKNEVNNLQKMASATLEFLNAAMPTDIGTFLYGEFNFASSLVSYRHGEHWNSAWEQLASFQSNKTQAPQIDAIQALVTAQ